MKLPKYTFGLGDRFHHQGEALLKALIKANEAGADFHPVFNKSNREHQIVKTGPADVRAEADAAAKSLGWDKPYFVDADHINKVIVDPFIEPSDFFTLDVADFIGQKADADKLEDFVSRNEALIGDFSIPGIDEVFTITKAQLQEIARKFVYAVEKAAELHFHIENKKGKDNFVTEVSMDEVDMPQSPVELFFILKEIAHHKIPAQTIAPRFSGRFNKGVEWNGDLDYFKKEFEYDLLVIQYAIKEFGLPENLKMSIHSGSDKFSIYPVMGELCKKYNAGIHVKTAGTTWLEELIGLAMAGGENLQMIKDFYAKGKARYDELTTPYAPVIEIDPDQLPLAEEVQKWDAEKMADTLRHIPGNNHYNPHFRQMMHVAYKIAAESGAAFTDALKNNKKIVGEQVTINILERHIQRLGV